jgi:hypothetical protein
MLAFNFSLFFLAVVAEAIRRDPEAWSDAILGYARISSICY